MKAGSDDAQPGDEREEGWDETVLVWNATVARIPPPATNRASTEEGPEADDGSSD